MSRIFRKIIKNTVIISIGTLLSRILGFVRNILIARFFGTGPEIESFFVAFSIPNMFRALAGEGVAESVVVPAISEYAQDKPKKEFYDAASSVIVIGFFFLVLLTFLGIILSLPLVKAIAFGFTKDAEKFYFTVRLTRFLFPYLLFICLGAIIGGILFVLKKFFAPSFSPAILNIILIIILLMLPSYPHSPMGILVAGVLVAGILQFFCHLLSLLKSGFRFNFNLRIVMSHPVVGKMRSLFIPRLWGVSVYHLNLLIDRALATFSWIVGPGGVAAVFYANNLVQFPLAVFGLSVSRAALPDLSAFGNNADFSQYKSAFVFSFNNIAFILLPASVGLAVLSSPIIEVIYLRGAFDAYSLSITSKALLFYSLGLFFFGGIRLLVNCFYSLQDTKTPAKTATFTLGVNIVLSLLLMKPLKIGGLALASSIAAGFNFIVLYNILNRRLKGFADQKMWANFFKILASSLFMGLAVVLAWNKMIVEAKILRLILAIALGSLVFFISSFIFRVEQARQIVKWLRRER
ncbi:MAG: murein biosynthesis integral membrane protein MurJ [Candidatus Omnitrophica bacterium]|nr:murein biosynthesis integral membrane protein MurJ [Candidatus Omnitrophota bacterium]